MVVFACLGQRAQVLKFKCSVVCLIVACHCSSSLGLVYFVLIGSCFLFSFLILVVLLVLSIMLSTLIAFALSLLT
jgi:hypothetical protein